MTHTCIGKLTITGSDNGLSPGQCQAIIWTNAGILSIGINSREILSKIYTFHSRKCIWKCCLVNGGHFVSTSICYWRNNTVHTISYLVSYPRIAFTKRLLSAITHKQFAGQAWGKVDAHRTSSFIARHYKCHLLTLRWLSNFVLSVLKCSEKSIL